MRRWRASRRGGRRGAAPVTAPHAARTSPTARTTAGSAGGACPAGTTTARWSARRLARGTASFLSSASSTPPRARGGWWPRRSRPCCAPSWPPRLLVAAAAAAPASHRCRRRPPCPTAASLHRCQSVRRDDWARPWGQGEGQQSGRRHWSAATAPIRWPRPPFSTGRLPPPLPSVGLGRCDLSATVIAASALIAVCCRRDGYHRCVGHCGVSRSAFVVTVRGRGRGARLPRPFCGAALRGGVERGDAAASAPCRPPLPVTSGARQMG